MKILLLKVPYCPHPSVGASLDFRTTNSFRPLPSLALAALGSWLGRRHEVQAVDLNMSVYEKPGAPVNTAKLPAELERVIRESEYDVLGISAMFAYNIRWVRDAINLSNKYHANKSIAVGGGLATLFPEEIDKLHVWPIVGEGEAAFSSWMDWGVYSHQDTIRDLGNLFPPDWNLLDVRGCFLRGADRTLPIEASRGCPYNCSYCTVTPTWGARVRYKRVQQVMDEIRLAIRLGAERVHFVDDNLAFDRKWFKEFLEAFIFANLPVKLDASNFAAAHLDPEIVKLMVRAGFARVCVAVESGSPEILKKIRKKVDLTSIEEKVRMMQGAGLWVHLCWMVGFPGETRAQIGETLALVRKLRAESNQILTVVPYPGTDLYAEAKAAGMLAAEVPLDRLDCRQSELLVNQEWDYGWLRDVVYDTNIEVNFMKNVCLGKLDSRFMVFLDDLLVRLPGHLVARLLAGWLHGDDAQREVHWKYLAEKLPTMEAEPFKRYLVEDHPAMVAFRAWRPA